MSQEKMLGGEEVCGEDVLSLEKPGETVDHALFTGRLYLKTERQILVANEKAVELPKGLKLKSNLFYSDRQGVKCLGELEGVTQEVF